MKKPRLSRVRSPSRLLAKCRRLLPPTITGKESVSRLVDGTFLAYNGARLREACGLLVRKVLKPDVVAGWSFSGALTPAGLGRSVIVPLIEAGFVDWIVTTGANLYHDLHFAFDYPLYVGSPRLDDTELQQAGIVRIYDVLLSLDGCLLPTDDRLKEIFQRPEFQRRMGTAELHYLLGKEADFWERKNRRRGVSVLAAAYRCGVPVYVAAPGDSSLALNWVESVMLGSKLVVDPTIDVNESSALVWNAKQSGRKAAAVLIGGGSPKNFMLQTEPQIQQVLKLEQNGFDYFLQVTDARPDTGGLSGATPHEAVSWGKVDPSTLPDAVVCYADATIALPILAQYALSRRRPRRRLRLYEKREKCKLELARAYRGFERAVEKKATPKARQEARERERRAAGWKRKLR
ncbi:MAG: deoxyhypusine synthase [candidate division WOR-3 bacterium]|nr:MAG: deoxyhypusine synthase [candidate division WOR-3 bacterium]